MKKAMLVELYACLWRLRVLNPILRVFNLSYHSTFLLKFIGQHKSLDLSNRFLVSRTFNNVVIQLNLAKPTHRAIYFSHTYERQIKKIIFNQMSDGKVFFDIGAHIGYYSLLVSKEFPKSEVYSFEANQDTFVDLESNIRINNLTNVHPFHCAITSEKGEMELNNNPLNDGGNSLNDFIGYNRISSEIVQGCTIDDIVTDNSVNKVDMVKIDVEGHQMSVLRGMTKTLKSFHPKIIIEFEDESSKIEIIDFLSGFHYSSFKNADEYNLFCN